jgi:hypothetical protein
MKEIHHSHQISQSTLIGNTVLGHSGLNDSDSLWSKQPVEEKTQ